MFATFFGTQGRDEGEDYVGTGEGRAGSGEHLAAGAVGLYGEGEQLGDFESAGEDAEVVDAAQGVVLGGEAQGAEAAEGGLVVGHLRCLAARRAGPSFHRIHSPDHGCHGVDVGVDTEGHGLAEEAAERIEVDELHLPGEIFALGAEPVGISAEEVGESLHPPGREGEQDVDGLALRVLAYDCTTGLEPLVGPDLDDGVVDDVVEGHDGEGYLTGLYGHCITSLRRQAKRNAGLCGIG